VREQQLSDIVAGRAYEDGRAEVRRRVLEELAPPRRVHLGDHLTLQFENTETLLYRIQEVARAERLTRDAELEREIDTYGALVGGDGELGLTLLIEIADPDERPGLLAEWAPLVDHVYARLEDGETAYATRSPRDPGEDELSSVHYMKLDTGGRTPIALGSDWEGYRVEVALSEAQRAALSADLAG